MAKNITKGKIGNALTSTANDHVVAVANDIYDETLDKYQNELNNDMTRAVFNNKNTTGVRTFEKLIVHCWVKNWTGGTKKLLCKFAFRADPTYKSGVMLHICNEDYSDEQRCTYWSSLEEHDGNKILPWAPIQVGDEIYGQVQVEVNWETLPLAFNHTFNPVYLDKESVEIPQSVSMQAFTTETISAEDTDSGLVKAKNIYSDTTLFRVGPDTLADYSNYIKEIYISNIPASGKHADDAVSLQHYVSQSAIYNYLYLGYGTFTCQLNKPCLNNIPYPIIYYNSSNPEYPNGTIGGYVVFKDAEGFFNTPSIDRRNVNINAAYARDINNSPIISNYLSNIASFKTDLFYRNNVYALEDNSVIRGINLPDLLLTPELLSKFICYLKFTDIQVLPTDNIKLVVNFQKNGQASYANYLAVYKNTDLIWSKNYGTNLPIGYSQVKHFVGAGYIALKVNWDAFKDIEDTTVYRSFSIGFNHDYLFDHNVNTEELDNAIEIANTSLNISNEVLVLAAKATPDFDDFVKDITIKNWNNPSQKLGINFLFRNDATYGSGFMIYTYNANGEKVSQFSYTASSSWKDISGIKSYSINNGDVQVYITVDWSVIPEGFNKTLKYPIMLNRLSTEVTTRQLLSDIVNIRDNFVTAIMPMLTKESHPTNLYRGGSTTSTVYITPATMANFLLDFKVVKNVIVDYGYMIETINYKADEGTHYNYYISIIGIKDGVKTGLLGTFSSVDIVNDIQQYNITLNDGNIAKVLVDWRALVGQTSGQYYKLQECGYVFDQSYVEDLSTGAIVEYNNSTRSLATEAIQKIDALNVTEIKTVWELTNDYNFWTSYYGWKALGQYTKPMTVITTFNAVRLNKVKCVEGAIADYKIYKVKGLASSVRQCPIGTISASTHTLLKEGELTLSATYKDYVIELNKSVTGNIGEQIVIYLVARNELVINMAGDSNKTQGNPEKTSNAALLSAASDPWTGNWGAGSIVEDTNKGYFNIALTLLSTPTFITPNSLDSTLQEKVPELIDEAIKPTLKIAIPDIVPAVVGTELNIWNDTITWSMDKGLMSPINYMVLWHCEKGIITERCFRFTPEDNDAGKTYSCSCTIFDSRGTKIDIKQFSIKVFAKNAIASPKRCVYFGDSLGSSSATQVIADFRNADKFTGTIPTFLGTRGSSTYPCEAVGGYGWSDYATKGRKAYRIMVTSLEGTVAVGAKYLFNTTNVLIREVNIIDGTGNLLIEANYGVAIPEFTESGTLTKVSGGGVDTINYTGGFEESGNPLWNNETNALDIALYRTRLGLSANEKLDAVSFQFGINDHWLAGDTYKLKTYIDALYNAFIADNPNCKFIIGLTTTSGNTVNGSGANYGATQDWLTYTQDVQKIRLYLLKLKASGYSNMFIASPQLQLDRYYGYAFSKRPVSQRVSTTEQYHNNHVHPGSSGYGQIGDAFFAAFTSVLSE